MAGACGVVCGQTPKPVPRSIAFVTYAAAPEGTADDRLALAPLAARGIRAVPAVWDDAGVDWAAFDAIVVRSTWDYFHHLDRFRAWIAARDRAGVPLFNAAAIMLANVDKTYLRGLERAGVPVVPTAWPGAGSRLADVLAAQGWAEAVVKPAVSGGAFETWRVAAAEADAHQHRFAALLARGDVLVQPFLPQIAGGEVSLVYFDGRFSHALVKTPRAGDFRVQPQHGGQQQAYRPSAALVAQGAALLAALPETPLYARVDGLVQNGALRLMELELVEPHLYLATNPGAEARFADAIARRLGG